MKWKLDSYKGRIVGTGWHLRDEDGCTVAIVLGTPEGELKPIADLIAAAPDLLEALEEVVAISDRKHDAWDKAKQAIAKAKGE